MRLRRRVRYFLRFFLRRKHVEQEIDDELASFLDLATEANLREGMSPEAAGRAARLELGGRTQVHEADRAARPGAVLDSFLQDIRYAIRLSRRNPLSTAVIVATLAMGIGVNTAIFSVVDALLFRPLPYVDAVRLFALGFEPPPPDPSLPPLPEVGRYWSWPLFDTLRSRQQSFSELAAWADSDVNVRVGEFSDRLGAEFVTHDYFPMLGVGPELGRLFLPEEDRTRGTHPVAMISHRFWQRHFGGDPAVLNEAVRVNDTSLAIVGVLPDGFRGQLGTADLWIPTMMGDLGIGDMMASGQWWLQVVGRLANGLRVDQARSELAIMADALEEHVSPPMRRRVDVRRPSLTPLRETKIDPAVDHAFLVLFGAVVLVLGIACANVTTILLARTVTRRNEFGVRVALGGGRGRILRQVLTETVLLSAMGGFVAIPVATLGLRWILTARPWNEVGFWSQYARTFDYFDVSIDWRILTFNLVVALGAGVLTGLGPALATRRRGPGEWLATRAGATTPGLRPLGRPGLRSVLIVAEIALSLALLIGAGLLVRSFIRLSTVDLGFDPENVIAMDLATDRRDDPALFRSLADRVAGVGGVERVALSFQTPLDGSGLRAEVARITDGDDGRGVRAIHNLVSPEFFDTYRIPLVEGRYIAREDRAGGQGVAVISRSLADRMFPGADPIGQRLGVFLRTLSADPDAGMEVVGVVGDVRYGMVEEPLEPNIYFPASQMTIEPRALSVRFPTPETAPIAAIRTALEAADSSIVLSGIELMRDRTARLLSRHRYSALMMVFLAGLAAAMTIIGVYGLMSHTVSQRTAEFGIRQAVGANRWRIFRLVIGDALILIAIGLALGIGLAVSATRVLASQLYDTQPVDLPTFAIVSALLALAALSACLIPARRATRVDPMVSLRHE